MLLADEPSRRVTLFPNASLLLTDRNDEIATLDRRKFVIYDVVGG